jgi:hypothetical protein
MTKPLRLAATMLGLLAMAAALPAAAQTEKFTLKGKRGPSLLKPGYTVGDYSGYFGAAAMNRQGFGSKDRMKAEFAVEGPELTNAVTASCAGGQSKLVIAWITWRREDLTYNCTFAGGAPADAALTLALGEGSFLQRLQMPQRAGELRWNGTTLRFETKQVGSMPIGAGKPLGYVFRKDGREIGAVDLNAVLTGPVFHLPPAGSPDRTAVMVAAMALYTFQDPAGAR